MAQRRIPSAWIEAAVAAPDAVEADPSDPALTRCYKTIPEAEGRVLRVVWRREGTDILVITAFLDRDATR